MFRILNEVKKNDSFQMNLHHTVQVEIEMGDKLNHQVSKKGVG